MLLVTSVVTEVCQVCGTDVEYCCIVNKVDWLLNMFSSVHWKRSIQWSYWGSSAKDILRAYATNCWNTGRSSHIAFQCAYFLCYRVSWRRTSFWLCRNPLHGSDPLTKQIAIYERLSMSSLRDIDLPSWVLMDMYGKLPVIHYSFFNFMCSPSWSTNLRLNPKSTM